MPHIIYSSDQGSLYSRPGLHLSRWSITVCVHVNAIMQKGNTILEQSKEIKKKKRTKNHMGEKYFNTAVP